jgi:hypothetical protein
MKSQKEKKDYPAPNARFNHDLQLQIDSIEWALEKVEINKFRMIDLKVLFEPLCLGLKILTMCDCDHQYYSVTHCKQIYLLIQIYIYKNN